MVMDEASAESPITLCDALDRVLNRGVVAHGEITIAVADVDLLRISLRALIAATDALHEEPRSATNTMPGEVS